MSEENSVKSQQPGGRRSSRRQFLAESGVVLTAASVSRRASAAPWTAKSSARVIGANDRIRVGMIGTGGMGTSQIYDLIGRPATEGEEAHEGIGTLVNAEVRGVCDVYQPWRERAVGLCPDAKPYVDYREMLGAGEIDCVIIAAPEHWHYQMAIDALRAGLDVYLQKPMTRTYEEAKKLRDAFRNSDRIFQLGSQYCQRPEWWRARQFLEEGKLGKVVMCQTSYHRNSREGEWNYDIEEGVEPGNNLDWDRWLGPLPWMPYDPEYFFRWRKYSLFSGGIITDLLPHKIHSIFSVVGARRMPRTVSCTGGIFVHPDRTVADAVVMSADYGDFLLLVTGSTCNEQGLEDMIRGHEATLYVGTGSIRVAPERPFVDEMDPIDESLESPSMSSNQYHMKEFFDSMRSRQQPTWDVESTYSVMTAIAMAEVSYREKREVHFDAEQERLD